MSLRLGRPSLQILAYAVSLALLFFLLHWLELRFVILDHAMELYSGAIALLFTGLGIWLATRIMKPKEKVVVVNQSVNAPFAVDTMIVQQMGLSPRELEVLQLMAEGLSNQEIADKLFLSLSTVKTHISRLFEKLEVQRRTQAVEKGRKMRIIQ